MAEAVISLALEKLDDLLNQEVGLSRDMEWEVCRLKQELTLMQAFVKDGQASKEEAKEEAIRVWIREAAEDVEDVVEDFISKLADTPRRSRGLLGRLAASFPNKLMKEIKAIRAGLQEKKGIIARLRFPGESSTRSEEAWWREPTFSFLNERRVKGLNEDVDLLLKKLLSGSRQGLYVAVVGMGGIGKTTLAQKLYNHRAVAAHFQGRVWVSVSSESKPSDINKKLMQNLLQAAIKPMDELRLPEMMYQHLRGRRYFIVLDDVWEDAQWRELASVFRHRGEASSLLITTRNRDITEHVHYVHEMKLLDPDASRQLFLDTVFFRNADKKYPEHLENIGREILRKCNGSPLAIKEVGMLLAMKEQSERGWEEVLKTMELSVMSAVWELDYQKLRPIPKLCALCVGFFKEGATIRAEKLVQVCVAVGVVQEGGRNYGTKEEIARSYLEKLISRNMVQVRNTTKDGRVKYCHIYGLFHKPTVKKAEEEISFQILGEEQSHRPTGRARHRAIHCSRERFSYPTNQDKHLRSLFFHGGGNFDDRPSFWKSLGLLRILDFEDFGLKKLPETVGKLTRLRYLGLRNNYLQELPKTLGSLKNLEVLDIALNFMVEVPNVIWEMDSLRHLYMSDIICKKPLKIDALKNLQTLTYISVDNWTYELPALQMMAGLRKLGIEELDEHSDVSKLFTSLARLENLDCLHLRGFRFRSMPSLDDLGILHRLTQLKLEGLLTTLPSASNFPPNLFFLTLVNTSLGEDPMPVLEKLSTLVYLKLRNAYAGDEMVISHDGFPQLDVLCIGDLWHLRNVEVEEGAMPMLKRLEIINCPYLDSLPEEVGSMTNLQELKMVTTTNIATMIRDSDIISSIPNVDIKP